MYDRSFNTETILIDLDHDSGIYHDPGGDYTYGTCDKCSGSGVWVND